MADHLGSAAALAIDPHHRRRLFPRDRGRFVLFRAALGFYRLVASATTESVLAELELAVKAVFADDMADRLAYDADMVRGVLGIFTRTVFGSLIRRAIRLGAKPNAQCGAVTFIQRFGSALNLNLHLHMLAIDGVYAADDDGNPRFHAVPAPGDHEIARLAGSLAERIPRWLIGRGLGPDTDPEEDDPL